MRFRMLRFIWSGHSPFCSPIPDHIWFSNESLLGHSKLGNALGANSAFLQNYSTVLSQYESSLQSHIRGASVISYGCCEKMQSPKCKNGLIFLPEGVFVRCKTNLVPGWNAQDYLISDVSRALVRVEGYVAKNDATDVDKHVRSALQKWYGKLSRYEINMVLKKLKNLEVAFSFFLWVRPQINKKMNIFIYNTLLQILGRARDFEKLEWVLGEMEREKCDPDLATYNELMKSYSSGNRYGKAMETLQALKSRGIPFDIITYSILIDMYCREGQFLEALQAYDEMQKAEITMDTALGTALIYLYSKMGRLKEAEDFFSKMCYDYDAPNVRTYTIMIDLYQKSNRLKEAVILYKRMVASGFKPNILTYRVMLSVFVKLQSKKDIISLNQEMHNLGVSHSSLWHTTLIEVFIKQGDIPQAIQIFRNAISKGAELNIKAYSLVLYGYLKLKKYSDAWQIFTAMNRLEFLPDLKTYNRLMHAYVEHDRGGEHDRNNSRIDDGQSVIWNIMSTMGHPIHELVSFVHSSIKQILNSSGFGISQSEELKKIKEKLRPSLDSLLAEDFDHRCEFVNVFVEYLVKNGQQKIANLVWEEMPLGGFLKNFVIEKDSYWSIHVHSMSESMVLTALRSELVGLCNRLSEEPQHFPEMFEIVVGWQGGPSEPAVQTRVKEYLLSLDAPFFDPGDGNGIFRCHGEEIKVWLLNPSLVNKL